LGARGRHARERLGTRHTRSRRYGYQEEGRPEEDGQAVDQKEDRKEVDQEEGRSKEAGQEVDEEENHQANGQEVDQEEGDQEEGDEEAGQKVDQEEADKACGQEVDEEEDYRQKEEVVLHIGPGSDELQGHKSQAGLTVTSVTGSRPCFLRP
jgi:hypothetical protein